MAARLDSIVLDTGNPLELGHWWAEALGWVVHGESTDEVDLCEHLLPNGGYSRPELVFVAAEDPVIGRRVRFDLNSFSFADQQATVERLSKLGADLPDDDQPRRASFVVMTDPEGNAFRVLDPRYEYEHLGSLADVTLAARDPQAIKDLWSVATGWDVTRDDPDHVALTPPTGGVPLEIVTQPGMSTTEANSRLHVDIQPVRGESQDAVVARLTGLGARALDDGSADDPEVPWVTLADPEGNELCVLHHDDEGSA